MKDVGARDEDFKLTPCYVESLRPILGYMRPCPKMGDLQALALAQGPLGLGLYTAPLPSMLCRQWDLGGISQWWER